MEKEFLYIGHYTDTKGNYILKIGTTSDLKRRKSQHTTNYRRAKQYTMPQDSEFEYDWSLPLSKYNTFRYEDKNKEKFRQEQIGVYVRNDRFCCEQKPKRITVKIKREYEIIL